MAQRLGDVGRHALRAVVLAVAGAVVAVTFFTPSDEDVTATARVAVSDVVGWPFYASAREQIVQTARDDQVRDAVREEVGLDGLNLGATRTDGQIIVELTASAPSEQVAVRAADAYAREVVAVGVRDEQEEGQQRVDALQARLDTVDQRITDNDAEIGSISASLDTRLPSAEAAVLRSRRERLEASQRQDAVERTQLIQSLTSAQLDAQRIEPEVELITPATSDGAPSGSQPLTLALMVGLPLFLVGIAASVVWDQTLGYVRKPSDVRWATDTPACAVAFAGPPDGPEAYRSGPLARRLLRHEPGGRWVIVPVGPVSAAPLAEHLSRVLDANRMGSHDPSDDRSRYSGAPSSPPSGAIATRRMAGEGRRVGVRQPDWVDGTGVDLGVTGGAVLAIAAGKVRLPAIRRVVRELEVEGLPLVAVAVLAPSTAPSARVAPSAVRPADAASG